MHFLPSEPIKTRPRTQPDSREVRSTSCGKELPTVRLLNLLGQPSCGKERQPACRKVLPASGLLRAVLPLNKALLHLAKPPVVRNTSSPWTQDKNSGPAWRCPQQNPHAVHLVQPHAEPQLCWRLELPAPLQQPPLTSWAVSTACLLESSFRVKSETSFRYPCCKKVSQVKKAWRMRSHMKRERSRSPKAPDVSKEAILKKILPPQLMQYRSETTTLWSHFYIPYPKKSLAK
nr:uncharacterized protein LOC129526902 [Gorilla gorilla gorilla]